MHWGKFTKSKINGSEITREICRTYVTCIYIVYRFKFQFILSSETNDCIAELASGDLEKFIPVSIPGPSTSMEDLDIKLEGSRPPSSSHTSLSEDPLSPPSQYYSEEEDDDEESDQDDQADSDLEVN